MNVSGVGGMDVAVPIASDAVGGSVLSRERMCLFGSIGCLCTYYGIQSALITLANFKYVQYVDCWVM